MLGKQYTDGEIRYVLQQIESGVSIRKICRLYGISESTVYRWCRRFGSSALKLNIEVNKVESKSIFSTYFVSRESGSDNRV